MIRSTLGVPAGCDACRFSAGRHETPLSQVAELTEDHEWDLTRSGIPAEKEVHCGHAAYLAFARRWRNALGATQLKIVEAKELPDGRLFTTLLHTGTGVRSGASVERTTVQLLDFEDGKVARTGVHGDLDEGRAAGGP